MSTKTTLKRIALVAVSTVVGGLLSIPAASAAPAAAGSLSLGAGTPARALATYYQTVNFSLTSGTLAAADDIFVWSTLLAKPTGSAVTSASLVFDASSQSTAASTAGTAANDKITQFGRDGKTSFSFLAAFEPDLAGSYQFLIYRADSAEAAYTAGNSSVIMTVTASAGAPASATITSVGGSTMAGTPYGGALLAVTLKDAAGNATVPNKFETVTLTATSGAATPNTVTLDKTPSNGDTGSVTGSIILNQGDFFGGEADVNAYIKTAITTADVVAFTASISGATVASLGSTNVSYAVPTNTGNATVGAVSIGFASTKTTTTAGYGTIGGGPAVAVDPSLTSHAWGLTIAGAAGAAGSTARTFGVNVTDTSGAVKGYTGYTWTVPVSLAAEKTTADFSISGSFANTNNYLLAPVLRTGDANGSITGLTVTATTNAVYTATVTAPATSVRSATGSSNTFTATVTNAYLVPQVNVAVAVAVAGRNATLANTNLVTNASGQVSYTVTDASTSTTNLLDTVTFTPAGGTFGQGFVNYSTSLTIGTVTVTGGSTADTAAWPAVGSSSYPINTGTSGAAGSTVTFKATVKDANGVLLSGIPVTWTVDKATSGITKSATADASVCYTNGVGTCTTTVYAWEAPSKVTVTATAGGKSGSGYANFVNAAGDARVVSATAAGNVVTAKVVDRYGNPVAAVNLTASTTAGYFGTGANTALGATGANGTVQFVLLGTTSATVTVTGSAATYGQLDDAAGKIGATAITAAVAGTSTGVGSSLAPAGVESATAAVTVVPDTAALDAANAASDAAAEAIDAANAATDAANLAAEAADAATVAAEEARDAADAATAAVEELATQVATLMAALKAQITTLANTVAKIAKKVRA